MSLPTENDILLIDKEARSEVAGILELCKDASEMNDEDHELHSEFEKALLLATSVLVRVGDTKRVRIIITGDDLILEDDKGGSQPAERVISDLTSWLEDWYNMKNVKVNVEDCP